MLEKGVSVSYDTVLRWALPPEGAVRGAGDCVNLSQAGTGFWGPIFWELFSLLPLIRSERRFGSFLSHPTLYSRRRKINHQITNKKIGDCSEFSFFLLSWRFWKCKMLFLLYFFNETFVEELFFCQYFCTPPPTSAIPS
jgi:hypothetical protein